MVRVGVYLATRPRYSTTVVVTGGTYYYAGGVYYVQQGTRYVIVSPPPGAVVWPSSGRRGRSHVGAASGRAAQPPGGDPDRERFSRSTGVPVEALLYSDFVIEGRWNEVDEALRGVYEEASEELGREFPYPG